MTSRSHAVVLPTPPPPKTASISLSSSHSHQRADDNDVPTRAVNHFWTTPRRRNNHHHHQQSLHPLDFRSSTTSVSASLDSATFGTPRRTPAPAPQPRETLRLSWSFFKPTSMQPPPSRVKALREHCCLKSIQPQTPSKGVVVEGRPSTTPTNEFISYNPAVPLTAASIRGGGDAEKATTTTTPPHVPPWSAPEPAWRAALLQKHNESRAPKLSSPHRPKPPPPLSIDDGDVVEGGEVKPEDPNNSSIAPLTRRVTFNRTKPNNNDSKGAKRVSIASSSVASGGGGGGGGGGGSPTTGILLYPQTKSNPSQQQQQQVVTVMCTPRSFKRQLNAVVSNAVLALEPDLTTGLRLPEDGGVADFLDLVAGIEQALRPEDAVLHALPQEHARRHPLDSARQASAAALPPSIVQGTTTVVDPKTGTTSIIPVELKKEAQPPNNNNKTPPPPPSVLPNGIPALHHNTMMMLAGGGGGGGQQQQQQQQSSYTAPTCRRALEARQRLPPGQFDVVGEERRRYLSDLMSSQKMSERMLSLTHD
eukprot:PhM_4_TR12007/c0_g1_i1/m.52654